MKKAVLLTLFLSLIAWSPLGAALDIPGTGTSYSFPLPAKAGNTVNLVYTMAQSGSAQILAYNESGDLVLNFKEVQTAGLQRSQVDLCCLAPGVYLYLVLLNYDSGEKERLKPAKFVVVR